MNNGKGLDWLMADKDSIAMTFWANSRLVLALIPAAAVITCLLCLTSPVGAFALGALAIAAAAAYRSPRIALWVSILFLPVYNVGLLWAVTVFGRLEKIQLHIYYFVIPVVFCAWALRRLVTRKAGGRTYALTILTVFFTAWVLLSWMWSTNPSGATSILIEMLSGVMACAVLSDPGFLRDRAELKRFFGYLLVVGVLSAIMTVVSYWYYEGKTFKITGALKLYMGLLNEKGRAAGFTGVNHAATFLNYFIFIGLSLWFSVRGVAKVLAGLAVVFLMIAVTMTGSKSGFGGLVAGICVLTMIMPLFREKRIIATVGIFGTLIASYVIATLLTTGDVSKSRVAAVGATFSYETRLTWWSKGFDALFNTSYGMGDGVGGFRKLIDPVLFAHNIFLSPLFDLGIIGFALFMLLLIALFSYMFRALVAFREYEDIQAILSCMIASMVGFLMNNMLQGDYFMRLFWLILGVNAGIVNMLSAAARERESARGHHHAADRGAASDAAPPAGRMTGYA